MFIDETHQINNNNNFDMFYLRKRTYENNLIRDYKNQQTRDAKLSYILQNIKVPEVDGNSNNNPLIQNELLNLVPYYEHNNHIHANANNNSLSLNHFG